MIVWSVFVCFDSDIRYSALEGRRKQIKPTGGILGTMQPFSTPC